MAEYVVTAAAQRPAREDGTCFYCNVPIGGFHKQDCVLIHKRMSVRLIIEYEAEVPAHWTAEQANRYRNDGTWCKDNAMRDVERYMEAKGRMCVCSMARLDYYEDVGAPYLKEE